MGIWNSFKGQVGRDTGKVVSNLIWKDKHASVYRRAEDRKQEALKLRKNNLKLNWNKSSLTENMRQKRTSVSILKN